MSTDVVEKRGGYLWVRYLYISYSIFKGVLEAHNAAFGSPGLGFPSGKN